MIDTVLVRPLEVVRTTVADMSGFGVASSLDMSEAGVVDAHERISPMVLCVTVVAYVT
jgi:hypothetical protein